MQKHRRSRAGEERDAPVHPQDFPKIARELGFSFTLRRGRVDWNKINSINVDRLVQDCDLATLQENLINVVNYNLDQEYDVKILDHNFVKLFKLAQLSIDYLLYSEQHLFNCVDELHKENLELKNKISAKDNCQQNHQSKDKSKKRHGQQPPTTLMDSTEYSMCHHCGKTFLSDHFLSSHILRRHLTSVFPVQNTETNTLRAEINELKTRLGYAEQMKQDNKNRLDVGSAMKDWQANLQEQYRQEMITIKNMFVNEIKKLQETKSDSENFPSKVNRDLMEQVQSQEKELITIRAHLQDKTQTQTELETLHGKLEAQERFWKSRLNDAQAKHSDDIANLKAQLLYLCKANDTQSTLEDLVKHTKKHDTWLALQAEQISKMANWTSTMKPNIPKAASSQPEDCLIDLVDNSVELVNNAVPNKELRMPVQRTVPLPNSSHLPSSEPVEKKPQVHSKMNVLFLDTEPANLINFKPKDLNSETKNTAVEDSGSIIREMPFSDISSISEGENDSSQKLNVVHYFPTKLLQAKSKENSNPPQEESRNKGVPASLPSIQEHSTASVIQNFMSRTTEVPTRSTDLPTLAGHSNSLSQKEEMTTLDNNQTHKRIVAEPKNETLSKSSATRPFLSTESKTQQISQLKLPETEDSSSESSDGSGSTITEESAGCDNTSGLAIHSVARMESALARNPQILAAFKEDIVEQFENRLRELAVDPQWQGIPTANYKKILATLQHQESIAAKKFKSFFEIKQNLTSRLDDRLGIQKNSDSLGCQPITKTLKSDKLLKNIPGTRREAPSDVKNKKILKNKTPPPRPPSWLPKKEQNTFKDPHTAKPPTLDEDSIMPYPNTSGSRIVTSSLLKEDSRHRTQANKQNITAKKKLSFKPTPRRHSSFDDDIDSLLDDPLKSPKRKFINPVSKSQDFLDTTSKTSREISPRSALKGALSTGSLVTKKRVVFSDQDEFNLSENKKSLHTNKHAVQISDKMYGAAGDSVNQTDQDSYTDSDFDLSSNQEDDSQPIARSKEPVIKLSTQQSNKIAQISHSIETQLRDSSRLKPVGGIEAMFQDSSFKTDETTKLKDDLTRVPPVPQPRKSDPGRKSEDDWDLEDLDDLLETEYAGSENKAVFAEPKDWKNIGKS